MLTFCLQTVSYLERDNSMKDSHFHVSDNTPDFCQPANKLNNFVCYILDISSYFRNISVALKKNFLYQAIAMERSYKHLTYLVTVTSNKK